VSSPHMSRSRGGAASWRHRGSDSASGPQESIGSSRGVNRCSGANASRQEMPRQTRPPSYPATGPDRFEGARTRSRVKAARASPRTPSQQRFGDRILGQPAARLYRVLEMAFVGRQNSSGNQLAESARGGVRRDLAAFRHTIRLGIIASAWRSGGTASADPSRSAEAQFDPGVFGYGGCITTSLCGIQKV